MRMCLTLLAVLVLAVCPALVQADDSATLSVPIQVSPGTLNLAFEGNWVTVHADIPYSVVASGTVTLNGVEVAYTKADDCGDLVAKFTVGSIKEIVSPGTVELTLSGGGVEPDGTTFEFSGSDTIRVIEQKGR